jgi:hypothetical protein
MLCWRPSVERLCRWGGGEAKSRRSATLPPQAPGHSGSIQRRLVFFVGRADRLRARFDLAFSSKGRRGHALTDREGKSKLLVVSLQSTSQLDHAISHDRERCEIRSIHLVPTRAAAAEAGWPRCCSAAGRHADRRVLEPHRRTLRIAPQAVDPSPAQPSLHLRQQRR